MFKLAMRVYDSLEAEQLDPVLDQAYFVAWAWLNRLATCFS